MVVILIVEDDASIRELVELILEDGGYETLSASDVEEATLFLTSFRPIDAVFTDIHLKSAAFGGCEVAKVALACRPGLPIMYTTAQAISKNLREMLPKDVSVLTLFDVGRSWVFEGLPGSASQAL
jgi:CheY-like chemotaxis protein